MKKVKKRKRRFLGKRERRLYGKKRICRIFGISETTMFRRLKETRAGGNSIPLPLSLGGKKGLRWDAQTVESFIRASVPQQALPSPADESTAEEYKAAIKELEAMDVKLPKGKK